jgi:hypothetical protein
MGMDVYGESPKNKRGEYFRNNCWWWRPLWDYVCDICSDILTEKDHRAGHYNDGHLIESERAERIANRLRAMCANGKVLDFEREYKAHMESVPDEICNLCGGSGTRTDMVVADGCNKCHGEGKVRPFETWYDFEAENVLEFAEFAEHSGGFRIS